METLTPKANTPRFFNLLSMLYLSLITAANLLVYKVVHFWGITLSVGAIIIPVWFILADIITEVYGYRAAKKMIWNTLFCLFILSLLMVSLIEIPSPAYWHFQQNYEYADGGLLSIYIVLLISIIAGGFLNSYLIAHWRVLLRGRYFWLRSMGASVVSQFIFSVVTVSFDLLHKASMLEVARTIAICFPLKMLCLAILAVPAWWITVFLKNLEGINPSLEPEKFNPFKL